MKTEPAEKGLTSIDWFKQPRSDILSAHPNDDVATTKLHDRRRRWHSPRRPGRPRPRRGLRAVSPFHLCRPRCKDLLCPPRSVPSDPSASSSRREREPGRLASRDEGRARLSTAGPERGLCVQADGTEQYRVYVLVVHVHRRQDHGSEHGFKAI